MYTYSVYCIILAKTLVTFGTFSAKKCPVGNTLFSQNWYMLQKMVFHGGK